MIGSLSTIKSHLKDNSIYEFKSLKEVLDFQKSYAINLKKIISNHENLIELEKNSLIVDLEELNTLISIQKSQSEQKLTDEINDLKQHLKISKNEISGHLFNWLRTVFVQWRFNRLIKNKEANFDFEVEKSTKHLSDIHDVKKKRYEFICSQFDAAVKQSSRKSVSEIKRKKIAIDALNSSISGAFGEQKVVNTLKSLSNDYYLINDFKISFSPAIYYKQDNEYIKSVQIDHILVAPSGVFLIETKNWSEESLLNLSLRSPIQQIKRASFILFKLVNNEIENNNLNLDKHHWGEKKISIKNIIVLINRKPKEEFQFVKILTLNELLGYIHYFKPVFSGIETQIIANFFLRANDQEK